MANRQKYDADIPEGHAFAETRIFHVDDVRLRRLGFKIERRPKNGPAVWSLKGTHWTQAEAQEYAEEYEKVEASRGQ